MEEIEFAICPHASIAELRDLENFFVQLQYLNATEQKALVTLFWVDSKPLEGQAPSAKYLFQIKHLGLQQQAHFLV